MTRILLGCFIVLFVGIACKKPFFTRSRERFWVENKSNHLIMTLRSQEYPDTSIPDIQNGLAGIRAGEKAPYDYDIKNWAELFDQLPKDTLSIFIFHADTIGKYNWQEIRSDYKVLKRYDISLQDLKNCNYIITYP